MCYEHPIDEVNKTEALLQTALRERDAAVQRAVETHRDAVETQRRMLKEIATLSGDLEAAEARVKVLEEEVLAARALDDSITMNIGEAGCGSLKQYRESRARNEQAGPMSTSERGAGGRVNGDGIARDDARPQPAPSPAAPDTGQGDTLARHPEHAAVLKKLDEVAALLVKAAKTPVEKAHAEGRER